MTPRYQFSFGAWLALASVAAIGVLGGRTLLRYVKPAWVKRIAGVLFAVLALARLA